jgi:hypothetical protein
MYSAYDVSSRPRGLTGWGSYVTCCGYFSQTMSLSRKLLADQYVDLSLPPPPPSLAAVILAFQQQYGDIISHAWFGDGYMLVGFSEGYVVAISTLMQEIGEEKFCVNFPNFALMDMAFSPILQRAAILG